MALREYVDREGRSWTVWSVAPRFTPVRSGIERRVQTVVVSRDRRVSGDRRRRTLDRIVLQGWLCFDSGLERRRLSPAPPDWEMCSEEALERYRAAAQPTRRAVSPLAG